MVGRRGLSDGGWGKKMHVRWKQAGLERGRGGRPAGKERGLEREVEWNGAKQSIRKMS